MTKDNDSELKFTEQIDYSNLRLLINLVIPVISYFTTKYSIKTYDLHREFKNKSTKTVDLPPEIIREHTEINTEELLNKACGDAIVKFVETLSGKIPDKNLTLMYNNLATLDVKTFKKEDFIKIYNKYTRGAYKISDNKINIIYELYLYAIFHELFHMSSRIYRKEDDTKFSGFFQENSSGKSIGRSLNEGYTEIMSKRYFDDTNDIGSSYLLETFFVEFLDDIVGKEKMETLYLNADLPGLIKELEQYSDHESIINFINGLDLVVKYISNKIYLPGEKKLLNDKLKELYDFLLSCFAKKLQLISDIDGINNLSKAIEHFITYSGAKLGAYGREFIFSNKEETINKFINFSNEPINESTDGFSIGK